MTTQILGKEANETLRADNPSYRLREVDQTAPAGMWQIAAQGGDLLFQFSTDETWTAFTTVITVTDTPSVTINGTITFSGTIAFAANVRLDDDIVVLFGDDSDYYMGYSATDDKLEIGTGATIASNVAISVDSSGNTAITRALFGATSAGFSATPVVQIETDATAATAYPLFLRNDGTAGTLADMGVGIQFQVGDAGAGPSGVGFIWGYNTSEAFDGNEYLAMRAGNTAGTSANGQLVIKANGNVGIGSLDPGYPLTVKGSNAKIQIMDTAITGVGGIYFADPESEYAAWINYSHLDLEFTFAASSGEKIYFDASGLDLDDHDLLNVNEISDIGGAAGNDIGLNSWSHTVDRSDGDVSITLRNSTATDLVGNSSTIRQSVSATNGNTKGDIRHIMQVSGGTNWCVGVDNDGNVGGDDTFCISRDDTPGNSDCIRIDGDKAVSFDDANASYTTFAADYACDGCGKTSISMFDCCGTVAWHDDVLALRNLQLSPAGLDHMVKLGIYSVDGPESESPGSAFINYTTATKFTWAGMWQNRQRMDAQHDELSRRLDAIGA